MGPVMPPSKKPESSGISVSSGLSQCYRGSGFSKALQEDDDLDFSLPDIRLEEGAMEDEELTNLNWLHESKNLLKSFGDSVLRSVSPVQDLDDDTPPSPAHSDMPYDARQNPNCKPPYSFSCLIFMAIEDSPTKRLPVKDIYNWILEHFPYFANAPTGWKNSVRHNLSLNKCFKKVDKERSQSIGKGSLWCIDPEYRQNLIQALKKTPYHPHSNVFNTPPASPQAYQSTSGPPLWPGSTFFKRNGALLQGSLSSGHFESLLELPLWLILLPTLGALHQSQIGSLAFHAHVSVPSVRRTCLVNSRPHKVPLCLLSALGEAPGMLPGLPERFYKDFAQPSQGQRPGHSCGKTCLCLYPWGSSKPAGL
ncbi:forkhead box protein N3-like isoform X2 [Balaenoptera acutorostrata]|uniref:Forkhead box protein N3 n=1 Tax=Balaenoptera acutorostrata TaxID=9767 RepID=A0ABM3T7S7_BALAC|nr:forkhead box protein N3-like isoform X2 [Balaenoptera acutorostrata]